MCTVSFVVVVVVVVAVVVIVVADAGHLQTNVFRLPSHHPRVRKQANIIVLVRHALISSKNPRCSNPRPLFTHTHKLVDKQAVLDQVEERVPCVGVCIVAAPAARHDHEFAVLLLGLRRREWGKKKVCESFDIFFLGYFLEKKLCMNVDNV